MSYTHHLYVIQGSGAREIGEMPYPTKLMRWAYSRHTHAIIAKEEGSIDLAIDLLNQSIKLYEKARSLCGGELPAFCDQQWHMAQGDLRLLLEPHKGQQPNELERIVAGLAESVLVQQPQNYMPA